MMLPFFDVEIIGAENLNQAAVPSAVMVSNHQSAVDSLIFGYLWRHNFRVRARRQRRACRSRGPAPATRGFDVVLWVAPLWVAPD